MSDAATDDLIKRMRAASDLADKVTIAGLARAPVKEDGLDKACETCIYFLAHRAWCDQPELDIPVDADWYCVLWRV